MSQARIIDTPENWDAASKGYSEKIAPFMMQPYADEFVLRLDVNDQMEVLEVAAGSGAFTDTLAKKVKTLLVTDFAPEMINIVKAKINSIGITNTSFAVMDGQDLALEDNQMDRALCCFGLMLFPERDKGFSELNRVIRSGGKALVSGWAGPELFEAFGLFMAGIKQAFPDFPKPLSPPPVFSLADLDSFKAQMEAGGFRNVEVDYVERKISLKDFDQMWNMMTVGAPPVQMLFDKLGPEGKHRVHDALRDVIENRFGSGLITLSNSATVGIGTVA